MIESPRADALLSVWAAQLTFARQKQGLTQRELAAAIGTSQMQVCAWENLMNRRPSVSSLVEWAGALGFELQLVPVNDSTDREIL